MLFTKKLFYILCLSCCNLISCQPITDMDTSQRLSLPSNEECHKNYSSLCELKQCKMHVSGPMKYDRFFNLASTDAYSNKILTFYVIGKSDCRITFSSDETPYRNNEAYDLLIGGFNNTRTVLRHGNKLLRNVETIDVLSASEPIHFKIEISPTGEIYIYRHHELLTEAFDPTPVRDNIRFFSFSTIYPTRIDYFYDCLDDNSSHEIILKSGFITSNASMHPIQWSIFFLYSICIVCYLLLSK